MSYSDDHWVRERPAGRLCRDPERGWLAGVCEGLGRHFRIDPSLVRIAAVAALFTMTKLTLVFYFLAWLLIPRRWR